MTLKVQSFNNGAADGVAVSIANSDDGVGNSALSTVSAGTGGSIVYDDDHTALTNTPWSALLTQGTTNTILLGMADTGSNNASISVYVYLTGTPAAGAFGIRSQTSAAAQGAKLYLSSTRFLQIVGGFGTITAVGAAVPLNTWVRLEFRWTGNGTNATFTAAWYTGHSTSPGDTVTSGSVAYALDCAEFRVGFPQTTGSAGGNFWISDWQQNIGSGASFIGPWPTNVTPTSNAGPDQTGIEPHSTVTLDGSGSFDPDGTISTYNWSVVGTTNGAATPSLSGASSSPSRTFKAPGVLLGTDITCRLSVTDDGGATSATDDVVISVLPVTERWVTGGVEVPVEVQVIP